MELSKKEIDTVLKARKRVRFNKYFWLVIPLWVIWLTLVSYADFPRLELPIPTVIMLFVVPFAIRPLVDANVLTLLDRYINADVEGLNSISQFRGDEVTS
ncbi:MAG: hypothetical protein GKR90_02625 [Pseudomonadales bacterium]|nr:hypothetical protein [Pseudomonadales bacterium]